MAISSGVAILFQHGASVNAMDLWQFTPLHEAASKNRVEVCSLLLAHGADPTLVNCHSKSALDVAPSRELQERMHCKFFWGVFPMNDHCGIILNIWLDYFCTVCLLVCKPSVDLL